MSESRISEADLYQAVESYLNIEFSAQLKPALGKNLSLVAITATSGPAASGIWSRPDLALVNVWHRKYQPVQMLDLYGFEVKRDDGCDVRSVHETLAHCRLVHFAYLVWNYRKADFESDSFKIIQANCAAYGLGLITFADRADGRSFVCHLHAKRANPDSSIVDEFIDQRFSEIQRQRLLRWIGSE